MTVPVRRIVNLTLSDLVIRWDEADASLYLIPGPLSLGKEALMLLEPGETVELNHQEEKE